MKVALALGLALAALVVPAFAQDSGKDACCANQRLLAGAMEMYKLETKLQNVKLDAALVQELRARGYLQREPRCGGAETYYTPLNPAVSVACRVHGVGTCPHDQALGPDRSPEQRPDLTRIALTDDDAAIEARYARALKELEPKLIKLRAAVQAEPGGYARADWDRKLAGLEAACVRSSDPVAGLDQAAHGFELATRLGREIMSSRKAQAEAAAQAAERAAAIRKKMDAEDAEFKARMVVEAAQRKVDEQKELEAERAPLSPAEKAALLAGKTNPADSADFGQRRYRALKWMRELSRAGKMSKQLFTTIERVENDYHGNPMQAARTLDKSIKRLGEIEKLAQDP